MKTQDIKNWHKPFKCHRKNITLLKFNDRSLWNTENTKVPSRILDRHFHIICTKISEISSWLYDCYDRIYKFHHNILLIVTIESINITYSHLVSDIRSQNTLLIKKLWIFPWCRIVMVEYMNFISKRCMYVPPYYYTTLTINIGLFFNGFYLIPAWKL